MWPWNPGDDDWVKQPCCHPMWINRSPANSLYLTLPPCTASERPIWLNKLSSQVVSRSGMERSLSDLRVPNACIAAAGNRTGVAIKMRCSCHRYSLQVGIMDGASLSASTPSKHPSLYSMLLCRTVVDDSSTPAAQLTHPSFEAIIFLSFFN